jgi:hypothetical protein
MSDKTPEPENTMTATSLNVGDEVKIATLLFTEGVRIADDEDVDVSLNRGARYKIIETASEGCVKIDTGHGIHVWLGAEDYEQPEIGLTKNEFHKILRLSDESTVMFELLLEKQELLQMIRNKADKNACLQWINENF